jgi:hypothetical protein
MPSSNRDGAAATVEARVDRVREALPRLMAVQVAVSYVDPDTGEPRVLLTHLFDFFDYPDVGSTLSPVGRTVRLMPQTLT